MDGQNALQLSQPRIQAVHVDLLGHRLQQDQRRLLQKWIRGVQQDANHNHTQRRVQVKHPARSSSGQRCVHVRQAAVVAMITILQLHQRVIDVLVVSAVAVDAGVNAGHPGLTRLPHEGEDDGVDNDDGLCIVNRKALSVSSVNFSLSLFD